jgi:hypothetical protein
MPRTGCTAGQVISSFEAIMKGKRAMPVPTYFLASQISVDPAESQVPGDGEGLCSLHSRVRKLHFLREYPATEAQYEMERMLVSHGSFRPELITRPVCVSHSTCALGRQKKIKTTDGSEAYADEHDEHGAFATALLGPDWRGAPREIAPNLHYLGPHGVADVHGLSVAFVSGRCCAHGPERSLPCRRVSTHGVRWRGCLRCLQYREPLESLECGPAHAHERNAPSETRAVVPPIGSSRGCVAQHERSGACKRGVHRAA